MASRLLLLRSSQWTHDHTGLPSGRRRWGAPGMVAVVSLLILAVLTVMATGLIAVGFREARIGSSEQTYTQALFNADAGTEEAKMRLSPTAPAAAKITPVANTAWRAYILSGHTQAEIQNGLDPTYGKSAASGYTASEPTTQYTYYPTVQTGSGAISWGWARIQYKVNGAGQILYLDSVTGNETTASTQTVGGGPVNNFPILRVAVRGVAGDPRLAEQAQREVHLELQPIVQTTVTWTEDTSTVVTDPFGQGAHGIMSVGLVGNGVTDSYDSRNGAYCASCPLNGNGNRHPLGSVGTDSVASGAISLTGNSQVNGSAIVGPGGVTSGSGSAISVGSNASITGSETAEGNVWNIPLSTIPAGVTNQGALDISGNRVMNLSMGTYWFSSISITGNAQLRVTGPVKIYVTGNINIAGNGVGTANNAPPNLLVYGTVDPQNADNKTTSVSVGGNGNFYGAIYAPAANITVNGDAGANVFGALTGRTVTMNSSHLHWDEALLDLGATTQVIVTDTSTTSYTTTGFKRYLWNEAML